MYLFCICVRAHFIRTYTLLTKQIPYVGLSVRKTLALRGKVVTCYLLAFYGNFPPKIPTLLFEVGKSGNTLYS